MTILNSLKWSFWGELASKVVQPIVFVILARVLTPEDFGVIASALMVIGFSQIIWEAGMAKALIRQQTKIEEAADVAFWINNILGVAIAIILFLSAGYIADYFFRDIRIVLVLKILSLQIILSALCSVHYAILQKKMEFKKIFYIRSFTISVSSIVSIPLALKGMGYWSLVLSSLLGYALQVVVIWICCSWRPKFKFSAIIAKEMCLFGWWVLITGILSWIFQWVDTLILGHYFSVHEVGLFRVGNQFSTTIFAILFSFLSPVIYSYFSSECNSKEHIEKNMISIFRGVALLSLPVGGFIYIFANKIEEVIFLGKWGGVGNIISLIAVKEAVLWIFATNMEAARALGRPHLESLVALLSAFANVVVLTICASYGFETFIFGRAIILLGVGFLLHFSLVLYVFKKWNKEYSKILIHISIFLLIIFVFQKYNDKFYIWKNINVSAIFILIIFTFYLFYYNYELAKKFYHKCVKNNAYEI